MVNITISVLLGNKIHAPKLIAEGHLSPIQFHNIIVLKSLFTEFEIQLHIHYFGLNLNRRDSKICLSSSNLAFTPALSYQLGEYYLQIEYMKISNSK